MIHDLKTWPVYFEAVADGRKPFELRKNDRNYESGDSLRLWYFDPDTKHKNGACIEAEITYILRGPAFGLEDGWCIMGIKPIWQQGPDSCPTS